MTVHLALNFIAVVMSFLQRKTMKPSSLSVVSRPNDLLIACVSLMVISFTKNGVLTSTRPFGEE